MKGLFVGLILGAIAAWCWYQTGGKISITEVKTVTNIVSLVETQIVQEVKYEYKYIPKTNEVWVTNVVERVAQTTAIAPVVQKTTEQSRSQPARSGQANAVPAPAVSKMTISKDSQTVIGRTAEQKRAGKVVNTGVHKRIGD